MDSITEKLSRFAYYEGLNYILNLELIKPYLEDISILLVGSVSTGLCTKHSDVDIALVCSQEIYDELAKDTKWSKGKPTEVMINGIQLHYYAITLNSIENKLKEADEHYLFVYKKYNLIPIKLKV